MQQDSERDLAALAECWQRQAAPPPPALLAHMHRRERRLRLAAALDWLGAAAMGGFALYIILFRFNPFNVFWALVLLAFVLWALLFSIRNRRDLWNPADESVQSYMRLSLLRLESRRRTLRFMWLLFAAELLIFALWQLLALGGWLPWLFTSLPPRVFAVLAGALAAMLIWTWLMAARIRREAGELEKIRRELERVE